VGAAVLVAAAATVLTSCSALGGTPAAAGETASGPVLDPSVPSASPTEIVASDTPVPVVTPSSAVPTAAPLTAVVPYITTADYDASARSVDVAAIVPGIVEGGGACVVTITSGGTSRTATGGGVAASSYTGCEAVTFKDVAAGSWQVRVRYESKKAAGSSAVRTVQAG
jgi:hypothetical protein